MHAFTRVLLARRAASSVFNTRTNDLIHRHIEHVMLCKRKNRVAVRRGDSGVAGEGRVVGVAKFHSWGKCTIPLTQIGCATVPLARVLYYVFIFFRTPKMLIRV